jgi:hypothetical protein
VEKKRINRRKRAALDEILVRRIAVLEARRLGLDKSRDYLDAVAEREESLLFGTFVQRVIRPDARASDDEIRRFFDSHRDEFTGPELVRLDAVAFGSREHAERAVARLRAGADFQWVREHIEGRLDSSDARVTLDVRGRELTTGDLSEGARMALQGAKREDLRIYEDPDGAVYVLRVVEVVPPRPLELEAARDAVARGVEQEKTRRAVEDWTSKLREASKVEVLVTPQELSALVARPPEKAR